MTTSADISTTQYITSKPIHILLIIFVKFWMFYTKILTYNSFKQAAEQILNHTSHKHIPCSVQSSDSWSVDMKQYLSLASCLFPSQFLGHRFLDRLRFLLRGGWDRGLQFSLSSSLLSQQLWVDVGQDSTCCDSHTFQQLRQEHKVKNWSSSGPTLLENRKSIYRQYISVTALQNSNTTGVALVLWCV